MSNLKNKKVIILAHILTTVPAEDLKEYFLEKKVEKLLFIGHPLFYVKNRPGAFYELYEKGKLVQKVQHKNIHFPSLIQYVKDVFLTLFWIFKIGGNWDLIIALDNLNTISGLFLKSLGRIRKVVYYTIDFVPKRFENIYLNNVYHYLEKLAVQYADVTWNLTERVAAGREKVLGMKRQDFNRQVVVPIGIWFNRIERKKPNEVNKHMLIYAGGLLPHQGVQVIIDAMPLILKEIPDVQFNIIGMGSYKEALEKQVKRLKLEKHVHFLGYMEDHKDVEKALASGGMAMAMYSEELSKWSYYADPSKVKTYLAAGLPVITTSLTQISEELEKRKCGVVIPYKKEAVAQTVISLMKDSRRQTQYREHAIEYARKFDWNDVLDTALSEIL